MFAARGEKDLQDRIEQILRNAGIDYDREHRLDAHNIPDFYLPETGMAVEVKVKGSPASHIRQLHRYAQFEEVNSLLLVTFRPGPYPESLKGKPVIVIALWKHLL